MAIITKGQITLTDSDYNLNLPYFSQSGLPLKYGSDGAAGLDLPYYDEKRHKNLEQYSKFGQWWRSRKLILPFVRYKLPTGIHVEMDEGEYGEIDSRSSTSKKKMLPLCRTIDEDYRGNIHVVFVMLSLKPRIIKMGECRFQMVIKPYHRKSPKPVGSVDALSKTARGENGFGHTDEKNKGE
jgi:dUTP pyrophosphatase